MWKCQFVISTWIIDAAHQAIFLEFRNEIASTESLSEFLEAGALADESPWYSLVSLLPPHWMIIPSRPGVPAPAILTLA